MLRHVFVAAILVATLGTALGAGSGATLAAMVSTTTNSGNAITSLVLYSPTGLTATHRGSANALSWTAASPFNGQGYVIRGMNNGSSTSCPASAPAYTTLVGSTTSTTFTDSASALLGGAAGSYICYLVQTGYSPAGGPPWASVPAWTSVDVLTSVATAIKGQVQQASATGAAASATATFGGPTKAGSLLVAFMSDGSGVAAATFPAGWVKAASNLGGSGTQEGAVLYYYENNPGGITSVSATLTGASGVSLVIAEFAGVATSGSLDVSGVSGGKSTTGSVSTSAATAYAGELAFVGWGVKSSSAQSWGESAGWTQVTTAGTGGGTPSDTAWQSAGSPAVVSETETWSSTANYVGLIATFK